MKVFNDEVISVSCTYSETTYESIDAGDFSDTGFVFTTDEFTIEELVDYIDRNGFNYGYHGNELSTEWRIKCYRTGTERSETIHLDHNANKHQIAMWKAIQDGTLERLCEIDDAHEYETRDEGRPVAYLHLAEFNEKQQAFDGM